MMPSTFSARQAIEIPLDGQRLLADLSVPEGSSAIVLFAHGSGSGRRSPRNRFVAEALERNGISTLLLDLLTSEEAREDEQDMSYRFRIPFLAERLVAAIDWAAKNPILQSMKTGLYGASTGGAAALIAAAHRPDRVQALVLRGARSDLATEFLHRVKAPTLLIVGGRDPVILEIARETVRRLRAIHSTTVVPQASHLFEEAGALETVTESTVMWFRKYLIPASRSRPGVQREA